MGTKFSAFSRLSQIVDRKILGGIVSRFSEGFLPVRKFEISPEDEEEIMRWPSFSSAQKKK